MTLLKKFDEKNGGQLIASFLFTISRSLPIETNIWKGHKNKGEYQKCAFPQGKITPSIELRNGELFSLLLKKKTDLPPV
jgi:hypothetical protein